MKYILLYLMVVVCSNSLMAQSCAISFSYSKSGYNAAAKEDFKKLYSEVKDSKASVYSRYREDELEVISIPILDWNDQPYKSGDNIELLLLLKQDFMLQRVLVVKKSKRPKIVGIYEMVSQSYLERQRVRDSIEHVQFPMHGGRPVFDDTDKMEKRIHKFCKANPNILVFMIKGMIGYWAIIDGNFVKLVLKSGKIVGFPGSTFACRYFGEMFVNDAISESFRIGGYYLGCENCTVEKQIKINVVNEDRYDENKK